MKRTINKIGKETSALGMGCWAIGGEWDLFGGPAGWGATDDAESIKTIEAAYDNGVRLFDTAATYGAGHSERLLGKALKGKRDNCTIVTKFGFKLIEEDKNVINYGNTMEKADVVSHIKEDCEASLRRLGMDYVDVFLFHIWDYDKKLAQAMVPVLEELVKEGKIKSYGWSTDDPELVRLWTDSGNFSSVMNNYHVAADTPELIELCEKDGIAALNKAPLAMGFLTGKYSIDSTFEKSDVRNAQWAREGFQKPVTKKIHLLRDVLTSNGRTLAQGALSWIWAKSGITIPTPGMRTVKQAEENARAMSFGPLSISQLAQVEEIMGR